MFRELPQHVLHASMCIAVDCMRGRFSSVNHGALLAQQVNRMDRMAWTGMLTAVEGRTYSSQGMALTYAEQVSCRGALLAPGPHRQADFFKAYRL